MHPYLNLENFDSDEGDSTEVEDAFNPGEDPEVLEDFLLEWKNATPVPTEDADEVELFRLNSRLWQKLRTEFFTGRKVMCGQLQLALSEESKRHIDAHFAAAWQSAVIDRNPYRMLSILRNSHTITRGAHASVTEITNAARELEDMRQEHRTLEELPDQVAVYHFIAGVTHPHGKTIRNILITQYQTAEFPLTVDDAFKRISAAMKAHSEADADDQRTGQETCLRGEVPSGKGAEEGVTEDPWTPTNLALLTSRTEGALCGEHPLVILDTGANINIVNRPDVLINRKSANRTTIEGVGGHPITPRWVGRFGPFGTAHYVPTSAFNILSFALMKSRFRIDYAQHRDADAFELRDPKTLKLIARFTSNEEGMYSLDATEDDEVNDILVKLLQRRTFVTPKGTTAKSRVFVGKVGEEYDDSDSDDDDSDIIEPVSSPPHRPQANGQAKGPTRHEKERGELAMRYHTMLNHPSDVALKALLAVVATISKKLSNNEKSPEAPYVGHTYHADICFVAGNKPHLRVLEDVSKYGTLIPLPRKDKASILEALQVWLGKMLAVTGNPARRLRTDNESVFSAISDELSKAGVLLQQSPNLPYEVPTQLHSLAAIDVVHMRNVVPNKATGKSSPLAMVTGRKPTIEDIAVPWGSVVLAINPNAPMDKSAARAELGVVVGHHFTTKAGSVDVLLIPTGADTSTRIVNRPSRLLSAASEQDVAKATEFMRNLSSKGPQWTADIQLDPLPINDIGHGPATATSNVGAAVPVPAMLHQERGPPTPTGEDPTIYAGFDPTLPILPPATTTTTPADVTSIAQVNEAPDTIPQEASENSTATVEGTTPSPASNTEPRDTSRYSLRQRENLKTPRRFINNVVVKHALNLTVKTAISQYGKDAEEAIRQELKQLLDRGVWIPIHARKDAIKSKHTKPLSCSMFLKEKFRADGTFDKMKARLVAGGHLTDPEKYCSSETSSATIKHESFMTVLSLAALENREIETYDFPGAYLYEKLSHTQVMRIPKQLSSFLSDIDPSYDRFRQPDGTILVNLVGALYGLPEAGKLWYNRLTSTIRNLGYERSTDDECLWTLKDGDEVSTLCLHVDDVFHTFRGTRLRAKLVAALKEEYDEIKQERLEKTHSISYLGIDIRRVIVPEADGHRRPGLRLTMPKLLEECLVDGNARGSANTPATSTLFDVDHTAPPCGNPREFLSKVMKLMYLARKCRTDILLSCSFLAARAAAPTAEDWKKLLRVYRYLGNTRDAAMTIAPTSAQVHAFVDASFAVHADAKGHSGEVLTIGQNGCSIHARSKKQQLVARSSTESELIALADSVSNIIMVKRIMSFLGAPNLPAIVYQDNKSTITMANADAAALSVPEVKTMVQTRILKAKGLNSHALLDKCSTQSINPSTILKFHDKLSSS
eukprot:gene12998-9295_t